MRTIMLKQTRFFVGLLVWTVFAFDITSAQLLTRTLFTAQELDSLAARINKVQTIYENFLLTSSALSHNLQTDKESTKLQFDFFLNEKPDLSFCVRSDDYNYWRDKFIVYRCEDEFRIPVRPRVFALGYDGSLFLLYGFEKRNVNDIIREKIGGIHSSEDAICFVKFYISYTFTPGYFTQVFIDDANRHSYDSLYHGLRAPKVRLVGKSYRVTLFSLDPSAGRVWRHEIILTRDKLIKHNHTVLRKGKNLEIQ
jgi:hypothetical protein